MTDAPADYTSVNIDLKQIEVTGDNDVTYLIDVKPGIYDLIELSNGKDVLISSAELEAGRVEQIRLILGDNNSIVVDGTDFPLKTPSAQQSGLKLQVHKEFEEGKTYNLLLDFDASASIVRHGNGDYSLKPVIRVIETDISGSVKGAVVPAMYGVKVTATNDAGTFNTHTNGSGQFMLQGLPEGTYAVIVSPPAPFLPYTIPEVEVNKGAVAHVGELNLVSY
jgi:hypothetical protein